VHVVVTSTWYLDGLNSILSKIMLCVQGYILKEIRTLSYFRSASLGTCPTLGQLRHCSPKFLVIVLCRLYLNRDHSPILSISPSLQASLCSPNLVHSETSQEFTRSSSSRKFWQNHLQFENHPLQQPGAPSYLQVVVGISFAAP